MTGHAPGSAQLDEGLHRLRDVGPEYDATLTNHGPMVVEALSRLGRQEAIERWVSGYLGQLDEAPTARHPIDEANWADALGDIRRVHDWELYFARQFADTGWRATLVPWWQRLLPGIAAGATHGIIRTSHAVRSLVADETAPKQHELARALSYWAARYQVVAGAQPTRGTSSIDEAITQLPLAEGQVQPGLIRERLERMPSIAGFDRVVGSLAPPDADVGAAMAELTTAFGRVFLQRGRRFPTAFVHTVTAPAAARSVLPLLPPQTRRATYDALWHLDAALFAVHARGTPVESIPATPLRDAEAIVDEAVDSGDEHCIKLAEACLSIHAVTGDETLLRAADRGLSLLPED